MSDTTRDGEGRHGAAPEEGEGRAGGGVGAPEEGEGRVSGGVGPGAQAEGGALTRLSAGALAARIAARQTSAVAATQAYLERIERYDQALGAYLCRHGEEALAQAAAVDEALDRGEPQGPLAGVPVALKDILSTRGIPTTCGSRMLAGFAPAFDATAWARLRDAGAVLLGKVNMDEFAMGSSTETSAFGATRNPWDPERVPGGSSGGSAAAVAASLCALSLGTDTGGSVRQPASMCGIVGLKPTYGRVSRYGVVAYASSLDQVGPVARSVADCALALEVIAGRDPRDATSIDAPVPCYRDAAAQGRAVVTGEQATALTAAASAADDAAGHRRLRVGVPPEYFADGLDPEVGRLVKAAIGVLEETGAEVVEVSLPHTPYAVAAYYLICTAEASSNLARYDGVRYGHREVRETLLQSYCATRAAGFGREVKRRIMLGTYALRAGYYDAYYRRAQQVRTLITEDFQEAFSRCDVIATPTSPVPAFRLGEKLDDPVAMFLCDAYTVPANMAGLPGISVPCGVTAAGLPVGLQLVGRALDEETLIRAAATYEAATTAWPPRRTSAAAVPGAVTLPPPREVTP